MPRPAFPVLHRARDARASASSGSRLAELAASRWSGAWRTRSECTRRALFGERMQEMQEEPRIFGHGAGDVARARPAADGASRGRAEREIDDGAAGAQRTAEGAARVDARDPARIGVKRRVTTTSSGRRSAAMSALGLRRSRRPSSGRSPCFFSSSRSDTVRRAENSSLDLARLRAPAEAGAKRLGAPAALRLAASPVCSGAGRHRATWRHQLLDQRARAARTARRPGRTAALCSRRFTKMACSVQ